MDHKFEYQCSRCGRSTPRAELTIKRVVFMTPGEGAKTLRARVTDHLCPRCVAGDEDWRRPPNQKIEYVPAVVNG
jgi:predicted RNA-binding Zn-ribbon protein involved in translation (DUF1610 family)